MRWENMEEQNLQLLNIASDALIQRLKDCIKNAEKNTDYRSQKQHSNRSINITKMTRKQKWK